MIKMASLLSAVLLLCSGYVSGGDHTVEPTKSISGTVVLLSAETAVIEIAENPEVSQIKFSFEGTKLDPAAAVVGDEVELRYTGELVSADAGYMNVRSWRLQQHQMIAYVVSLDENQVVVHLRPEDPLAEQAEEVMFLRNNWNLQRDIGVQRRSAVSISYVRDVIPGDPPRIEAVSWEAAPKYDTMGGTNVLNGTLVSISKDTAVVEIEKDAMNPEVTQVKFSLNRFKLDSLAAVVGDAVTMIYADELIPSDVGNLDVLNWSLTKKTMIAYVVSMDENQVVVRLWSEDPLAEQAEEVMFLRSNENLQRDIGVQSRSAVSITYVRALLPGDPPRIEAVSWEAAPWYDVAGGELGARGTVVSISGDTVVVEIEENPLDPEVSQVKFSLDQNKLDPTEAGVGDEVVLIFLDELIPADVGNLDVRSWGLVQHELDAYVVSMDENQVVVRPMPGDPLAGQVEQLLFFRNNRDLQRDIGVQPGDAVSISYVRDVIPGDQPQIEAVSWGVYVDHEN